MTTITTAPRSARRFRAAGGTAIV
ncbi:MAG: hypothetical protein JWM93_1279, partial [Frankiales bacterium]|nr:hypothetical protein [Frankiales bacterium]